MQIAFINLCRAKSFNFSINHPLNQVAEIRVQSFYGWAVRNAVLWRLLQAAISRTGDTSTQTEGSLQFFGHQLQPYLTWFYFWNGILTKCLSAMFQAVGFWQSEKNKLAASTRQARYHVHNHCTMHQIPFLVWWFCTLMLVSHTQLLWSVLN